MRGGGRPRRCAARTATRASQQLGMPGQCCEPGFPDSADTGNSKHCRRLCSRPADQFDSIAGFESILSYCLSLTPGNITS
jgi:hypothetical protein